MTTTAITTANYKLTAIGMIPSDWELKKLGDVSDITTGKKDVNEGNPSGEYPFFTCSREHTYCDNPSFNCEAILVAGNGEVGNLHYYKGKFEAYQRTYVLHQFKINVQYLWHQLDAFFKKSLGIGTIGTSIPYIKKENLYNFLFSSPREENEQTAISSTLSDVNELIEGLEILIAKKRAIKQGTMQKLFTPNKTWITKKLESIADVIDPHPSHRAPPIDDNGIPFVGIGDLNEAGEIVGSKLRKVNPSIFDEHHLRYDLSEELIGLGRVASIGKVVKLKFTGEKYAISPTLGIIRGTNVSRGYLLYSLQSKAIEDQFLRIMSGSTRSSVGMIVLRRLDIAMPKEKPEQEQIAQILSDMDEEISTLKTYLAKATLLRQGMLQVLLTGKIRLLKS